MHSAPLVLLAARRLHEAPVSVAGGPAAAPAAEAAGPAENGKPFPAGPWKTGGPVSHSYRGLGGCGGSVQDGDRIQPRKGTGAPASPPAAAAGGLRTRRPSGRLRSPLPQPPVEHREIPREQHDDPQRRWCTAAPAVTSVRDGSSGRRTGISVCAMWPRTLHTDHDTICSFRRNNLGAIGSAFEQVLLMARELKLLRAGMVSVDGAKVDGNVSKGNRPLYGRVTELREQLQKEIAGLMEEAERADGGGRRRAELAGGVEAPAPVEGETGPGLRDAGAARGARASRVRAQAGGAGTWRARTAA